MANKPSSKQQAIYQFIAEHIIDRGYPPTVREIGEHVGLKSTATVHGHLARLEKKGMIRRDASKPRAIELTDDAYLQARNTVSLPILGAVAAGQPILAVEHIEGYLPFSSDMLPDKDCFALRVRGESMIEAGILDGDYIVARQTSNADNGDIVVALLEDEATVKRFKRESDHVLLIPENQSMQPIHATEVSILGKVIALVRRF